MGRGFLNTRRYATSGPALKSFLLCSSCTPWTRSSVSSWGLGGYWVRPPEKKGYLTTCLGERFDELQNSSLQFLAGERSSPVCWKESHCMITSFRLEPQNSAGFRQTRQVMGLSTRQRLSMTRRQRHFIPQRRSRRGPVSLHLMGNVSKDRLIQRMCSHLEFSLKHFPSALGLVVCRWFNIW